MEIRLKQATKEKARRERRRLAPQARRALIEGAAGRVFAERGYEAATMQEIAASAGVVASVLYDHYPSKRMLYVSLLEQHGRALMARTIWPSDGTEPRARLRSQIDEFLRTIEESPFLLRMLFHDPPPDPAIIEAHERVQTKATEAMSNLLGGEIDAPERAMVVEMAKSSLAGLARWRSDHPGLPRERLVDTATSLIWGGLSEVVPGSAR